jgi:hypothetical protein
MRATVAGNMKKILLLFAVLWTTSAFAAGEVARLVRYKLSAGDITSAIAAAEDYKAEKGIDPDYLDAIGWIARGAEILKKPEIARSYVAELHRLIPIEADATLSPFGAAIEVEGRLIAASDGRGAAIRYFEDAYANAKAVSLRSRIRKNINMLSLEGQRALPIEGQALQNKPTLLFFWMAGCGDCKGQGPSLNRVWSKYKSSGLQMIGVTRQYDGTPDEIQKFWKETYPDLSDVPVVISTDTMVRYGVSATPTFALVDRGGIVRLYTPTRLSETELSRKIEELMK